MLKDRYMRLSEAGAQYQNSSVIDVQAFDKTTPILVTSVMGSSSTNPIVEKTMISWSKVIGTPLKEEIPLSYGTTTFRSFTRADQPVAKISPIEDNMIIDFQFHMYFVMKDIKAAE
jgi:hypothetical protein